MLFAENKLQPEQGRLLIAEPFLPDNFFRRSIVLLTEHNEKGTIGFMLNRPVDLLIHEVIPDFPEYDNTIFFGGPVQRDQLYYIHTLGESIPGSFPVAPGLWWLGDFELVKNLIEKKEIGHHEIRFFIGYSGWETGQLDREITEKSWFVSEADRDLIFADDPDKMWGEAMKKMGKDYAVMANFPEDPSLN